MNGAAQTPLQAPGLEAALGTRRLLICPLCLVETVLIPLENVVKRQAGPATRCVG